MAERHLSVSQIERYSMCGESWRLRYSENIREPSTPDCVRGTAVHQVAASSMVGKRAGNPMMLEEVEQLASDAAKAVFSNQSVMFTPDDAARGLETVKGEVADAAVALSRLYHIRVAPGIEPVAIEQKISLNIPGLPEIISVLDLTDSKDRVRDLKTKSRAPNAEEANKSIQLSQYHLSFEALNGRPPSDLMLDHVIYHKPSKKHPDGEAVYVDMHTTRSPEQLQAYLDRVSVVNESMEKGIAVPASPTNWKCDPKWCGYYGDLCRYTRGMSRG